MEMAEIDIYIKNKRISQNFLSREQKVLRGL